MKSTEKDEIDDKKYEKYMRREEWTDHDEEQEINLN